MSRSNSGLSHVLGCYGPPLITLPSSAALHFPQCSPDRVAQSNRLISPFPSLCCELSENLVNGFFLLAALLFLLRGLSRRRRRVTFALLFSLAPIYGYCEVCRVTSSPRRRRVPVFFLRHKFVAPLPTIGLDFSDV